MFFVKKKGNYEIRWFTPKVEIDLAGHPTLAASHVIYNHLDYKKEEIVFQSKSGELVVRQNGDRIVMNFPSREPLKIDMPDKLFEGLGVKPVEIFKARDLLVLYDKESEISNMKPRFDILEKLDTFGIIITAKGDNVDFVPRFFAPKAGINEDPVTGSAHSALIPFWAKKLNKNDLYALQLSERKGELFCKYLGNRVEIGGRAVTFFAGEICL